MDLLAAVDWYTIIAALCFFQALVWAQHLDRGFPPWLNWLTVCVLASVFSREPGRHQFDEFFHPRHNHFIASGNMEPACLLLCPPSP